MRRVRLTVGALASVIAVSVPFGGAIAARADSGTSPTFVSTIGGPGHACVYPGGLEIAPDGGVVVADTGNDRVAKWAANGVCGPTTPPIWTVGTPGTGTGQFLDPRDIAIDSASGTIYVADNSNGRIVRLDANGNWLGTFHGPPGDPMGAPIGVSASGGKVYVADAVQRKVRVFNVSGQQILTIKDNGVCTLNRLRDAAADAAGNVYVADYQNQDILKFDQFGTCITKWGTKGIGPGQFKNPYGVTIAVDPLLNGGTEAVYVADSNNNRIQEFDTLGNFVAQIGSSGTAPGKFTQLRRVAVAKDGSGDVWGADLWGYRLERFARGTTLTGYTYAFTIGGTPPPLTSSQTFNKPHGIAFDSAGNLEVVDTVNQRLINMKPDGTILGACGQRGFQAGQENWPRGVAIDQVSGNTWIADTKQSNIQIISPPPACTPVAQFGFVGGGLSQFNWPFSIVIRQADHIAWVADTLNNRIVSYNVTTHAPIAAFGSLGSGSGQFNRPTGIAVDPTSGHVMVADENNNRIVELSDTSGGSIAVVRMLTDTFNGPQGVGVDFQGRVYIADTFNNRLVVLKPDGTELASVTAPSGFNQPENLAVDANDNLYVADTYNDRLLAYRYNNPVVTLVSPNNGPAAGGTAVTITGSAFTTATAVSFGGVAATAFTVNTDTQITATSPAGTGTVDIRVTSPSGQSAPVAADHFTYQSNPPTVTKVSPISGPVAGGTSVTITGTGFTAATAVSFGGVAATTFTVNSDSQITATSPAGTSTVDVQVTSPGGTSAPVAADHFTYTSATTPPHYLGNLEGPGLADMYPVAATANAADYYVMDAGRYRVVAVNRTTGLIDKQTPGGQGQGPGQFGDARAVALDFAGNLYVADTPNNRIEKFDTSLNFVSMWGSGGTGNGQFNQVYGVAVGMGIIPNVGPGEVLYAVDGQLNGQGRVEEFDLSGNYLSQFNGGGTLVDPRQITVAPNTDIYVLNARKHECDVFDENGNFRFKFGSFGTGNGQFTDDPRGVAVSVDGSLAFVTDSGGKRVEAFTIDNVAKTGTFVYHVGLTILTNPRGLAATSDNHLLVADEWGFGLHEFTFTSSTSTTFRDLFGGKPPVPGVNSPRGIRVDANGRIYMVDWWNQRIDSINPDGSNPLAFGQRGTASQPGAINFAWDAAIEPSTGRIFVANRESHQIEVFNPDGTNPHQWGSRGSNPGQFLFPQGLTFAPDGTLLVANTGNGRIDAFNNIDPITGVGTFVKCYGTTDPVNCPPGFLNVPTGVSAAADGTIWVADTGDNSVQSVAPDGVTWTRFTAPGAGGINHFRSPWGVTVAPDGMIWVSDTGNNRLVKMDPSGNVMFTADGPTMGVPGLPINPFAVAFGQNGHIYMTDVWNNQVIDLVGT